MEFVSPPLLVLFFLLGSVLIGWFFLRPIQSSLSRFRDDFIVLGKHLGHARSSYQNTEKRLEQFGQKLVFADTEQTEPFEARALERATG